MKRIQLNVFASNIPSNCTLKRIDCTKIVFAKHLPPITTHLTEPSLSCLADGEIVFHDNSGSTGWYNEKAIGERCIIWYQCYHKTIHVRISRYQDSTPCWCCSRYKKQLPGTCSGLKRATCTPTEPANA